MKKKLTIISTAILFVFAASIASAEENAERALEIQTEFAKKLAANCSSFRLNEQVVKNILTAYKNAEETMSPIWTAIPGDEKCSRSKAFRKPNFKIPQGMPSREQMEADREAAEKEFKAADCSRMLQRITEFEAQTKAVKAHIEFLRDEGKPVDFPAIVKFRESQGFKQVMPWGPDMKSDEAKALREAKGWNRDFCKVTEETVRVGSGITSLK